MPLVSGKTARIDGKTQVAGWDIAYDNALQESRTSASAGAPVQVAGNNDWTGSYRFHGKVPPNYPGESFAFKGHTGTASGKIYSGTAMVSRVTVEADVEGANIIGGTVEFEGDGALTRDTGTAADAVAPAPVSAKGVQLTYNGVGRTDLRTWRLTLSSQLIPYNSTATNGNTKRIVGNPSVEWEWTEYEADPSALPAVGDVQTIRFYVDATTYYEVVKGVVQRVSNDVDIEGAGASGVTIGGAWTAYTGGVQGAIAKPGGGNWYP